MKKDRNLHPKDMSPEKTIKIEKPCQENSDGMTLSQGGRFCDSCEKVVHDLTKKSDAELIRLIKSKGENICGRFYASQLNRPLIPQQQRISPTLSLKAVVLGIGLLACFPVFSMEEMPNYSDVDLISVIQNDSRLQTEDSLQVSDSIAEFRLKLINSETDEPAFFETVILLGAYGNILAGAQCDLDGVVVLSINENVLSQVDSVEIGRNSYTFHSIKMSWEEFKRNPNQNLSLKPQETEELLFLGMIIMEHDFDIHNPNPSTTFKRKKPGNRD